MDEDNFINVGVFREEFNKILGTDLPIEIIYQSKGLPTHMIKRQHYKCLKYINNISDIINNPDYIGVNPNESGISIEFVKKYNDNVMIGIKLNVEDNYLYVSTMHDITASKISNRLFSGRLKIFSNEIDNTSL
ncbi:PBECR3 domain-containing polyvalent protein [[Clostridium] fimetarium]|uniref:Phage-Barnase-EndoU-ColicinE5/D-RelE like nuclease 3 domain-containing protein n=1 Tax=[Clostridium] fimetarium TaxID=99656 RepID=A0A1I0LZH7_9FIRM|nr:PBECR2 nuclease fold domain-containing protein [[Clostridium] fimetarium]SEV81469.1 hypothetical protein SAMN05421659_10118 [[Clostridium] fimetarium]